MNERFAAAAKPTQFLPVPPKLGWALAFVALISVELLRIPPIEMYPPVSIALAALLIGFFRRIAWPYVVQVAMWGFGLSNLLFSWARWERGFTLGMTTFVVCVAILALHWRALSGRNWVGLLVGLIAAAALLGIASAQPVFTGPATIGILAVCCLVYGLFFIEVGDEPDNASDVTTEAVGSSRSGRVG